MQSRNFVLLAVDDDPVNLNIIQEYLDGYACTILTAEDGYSALRALEQHTATIDVVLLDRMMPGMDGIEVLQKMKGDTRFSNIPVILQTAAGSSEQIAEGIRAGCFYYLTKPYNRTLLREVLANALRDVDSRRLVTEHHESVHTSINSMKEAAFGFRTRYQAQQIAAFLSNLASPGSLGAGLMELMVNAVEHGMLGITYDEKTRLILDDQLSSEIEKRLNLPEHAHKQVTLLFKRLHDRLEFTIRDGGAGFDWERYLDFCPERIMDNHGRGIAIARKLSFSNLEYQGNGNTVVATVLTTPEA